MAIIKCKMCGGDLVLLSDSTVAECEYCGTVQTIPSADNEKKLTLFARANRLRMACEFDKASGVYEAIVADFPEEAEAYWGLVLCKYGIEYVDDPASGKKVPTCHRSSFDSVMDDSNYEQALENADVIARKVYREEAKQIEEIRKGIVEVSSKEDPYDVFICYKETDTNGDRTLDSVLAEDLYDALTEKGYRVFFSRISLEDKLGQEYEPYIFAALNSAKVMLAVGTDYEYYNAVWVKNEWSRFLHMISAGQKKTLIPCYKNIDAYDMPKEFAKLQAQDLGKIGAMQDLLRGIEKIIGNAEPHKSSEYTFAQPFFPNNNSALLKRGFMALEDSDWVRANEFFEKALDQDAECGEAYFGLYLAENKLRSSVEFINSRLVRTQTSQQEELEACSPSQEIDGIVNAYLIPGYFEPIAIRKLFDFPRTYISCVKGRKLQLEKEIEFFKVNKNLIRAGQYARGDFAARFKQIQQDLFSKMKDRIAEAEKEAEAQKKEVQQKYKSHIDATKKKAKTDFEKFSQWREKDYQDVLGQYHRAETSSDFRSLSMKFEAFKGYKESKKLAADCREKADKQAQKERQDAIIRREAEEKRLAAEKAEAERLRREKAEQERAAKLAEEKVRMKEAKKKRTQKIVCAFTILLLIIAVFVYMLIIHPSMQYDKALSFMQEGNYTEAATLFESLGDYKTSLEELQKCNDALTQIKYEDAVEKFECGDLTNAMYEFHELGDYSDSERYYAICEIENINQTDVFDTVTYGKFEGENIRWIVLEKTENQALLIAENYLTNVQLDANRYHDDYNDRWIYHFWSNSSLREWLNGEFLNSFSSAELERICETNLSTDEYETENYDGWNEEEIVVNTTDRIYIPTIEDIFAYSLYTDSVASKRGWLRDRGHGIAFVYTLDEKGSIDSYWSDSEAWVRPMMSVSLEGLEIVENEPVIDCYNEQTPFSGKYWVIYRNGNHDERIEATSVDSTHAPELLHAVLKNYELSLNDNNGTENWTGYVLSSDGKWVEDNHYWTLADKTKTIIASNMDIYDAEGNLILKKSQYTDIDWSSITTDNP